MEELLTPAEMAVADRLAGNVPALIQAAGRAIARAVAARIRPCRTLVLTGPGNNGADGKAAAEILAQAGWPARAVPYAQATEQDAAKAELVIDAIFGAGLSRDIPDHAVALLKAARRIVAVDVPSGVDGLTGGVRGYAPQAEFTVTFFRLKPGHLLYPGRALCGEVLLRDIGLPASVLKTVRPRAWRNGPHAWALPKRAADSHKYASGDVTVLGGMLGGAARLACAAARRAGAGMVTLLVEQPLVLPEAGLIVRDGPIEAFLGDERRKVWVCGPGLGVEQAGPALAGLIGAGKTVLADAGALTACAGTPGRLRGTAVITPHEGEFARVFGRLGEDRLATVRAAAAATGAVVLLKGPSTVIAAPDGRVLVNDNGTSALATGGTGDVLSGLIAALLARGMPAFEAAGAGAWIHGAAGQALGPGLLAEDLPQALPEIMNRLSPARLPPARL